MVQSTFSLKERDQKRLIKDRLVRLAVTCGGVSVLGALVLIFIYLGMVVLPLFSDSKLEPNFASQPISASAPQYLAIDEYGERGFIVRSNESDKDASAEFWLLNHEKSSPIWVEHLNIKPTVFATATRDSGWFAMADSERNVVVVRPQFLYSMTKQGRGFTPELERLSLPKTLSFLLKAQRLSNSALRSLTRRRCLLAILMTAQCWFVGWILLRKISKENFASRLSLAKSTNWF